MELSVQQGAQQALAYVENEDQLKEVRKGIQKALDAQRVEWDRGASYEHERHPVIPRATDIGKRVLMKDLGFTEEEV